MTALFIISLRATLKDTLIAKNSDISSKRDDEDHWPLHVPWQGWGGASNSGLLDADN